MDPEQILLPALVAITSLGALVFGARRLRLRPAGLRQAGVRALETIGLLMVFTVLNLALGVAGILAWRGITGEFVSLYVLNDAVLGLMSLLQAVIFHWWWLGRP